MNELEKCLEAISNRSNPQEVGIAEWDLALYPPRFKAPNLHAFDGKGSLSQHIYCFKSQSGNVVSNDVIMDRYSLAPSRGLPLNGS